VPVNVVFFHYFRDGGAEYLGRSWLRDPAIAEDRTRASETKRTPGEWNGRDYYVMYGHEARRSWDDARKYGYVSAGGGGRWSNPLFRLHPARASSFTSRTADTSQSAGCLRDLC
jgi:hypothetical protein